MNVNGVSNNSPIEKINPQPVQRQVPPEAPKQNPLIDKLELSGMGELFKALQANDIRSDRVADIKARLEAGTYEDDHKLDLAIDRLLNDL